jgi:hypothetical protein
MSAMKLVIELEGGMVSSVYYTGLKPAAVYIVDLDNVEIGESTEATEIEPEPLRGASDIILESIPHDAIKVGELT